MLKSPSSILNSIQRMKTNLRNDKQQLRIIKTNFVYLDHIQPRSRPFDHETKVKNRSKSVLNSNQGKQMSSWESPNDKQNEKSRANVIQKDCESRITIKDQASTQRDSVIKTNRVYMSKQQNLKEQDNILSSQSNFKKSESSRVSHHLQEDKQKQSTQIKSFKARYQQQIEKLKQSHQLEKRQLVNKLVASSQQQRQSYQRQITEMREYIQLLQSQLNDINVSKATSKDMVDTQCQMTQKITIPKAKPQTVQQQTQTVLEHISINYFSSISSGNNNHFNSQEDSHLRLQQPNSQNLNSHPLINGICVHQNNLIEQLCLKYFGDASNDYVLQKQANSSQRNQSEEEGFQVSERQKYEHIINKLLEENTKLYNKMQKIYGQAHSSENPNHPNNPQSKQTFFKNYGINYKTVTSHGQQQSHQHSSVTQRSRVINKYPTSKQSPSNPAQSMDSNSQFASNREASIQSKSKQSIVYRISNVMSASGNNSIKQGKSSSRSKIPAKNPPIKTKQGINVSMPYYNQQQRRMKTEMSQKASSQFYSQNFHSNPISSFDTIGRSSNQMISSEERIPTMRQKLKNQPSFKFYDDDSQVSQKANNHQNPMSKPSQHWQEQSESEIKDDEIKLKTIKNFKCMQNQAYS